jgi:hypothetical protein
VNTIRQSCEIRDRDIDVLTELLQCRVMTRAHIATRFFTGSDEAAKQRLRKLKGGGFLGERQRAISEPGVLFLTRKALHLLKAKGILAKFPSISIPALEKRAYVRDQTLKHELDVIDVKVAFHSAINSTANFKITEFSTWPKLNEFRACPGFGFGEITVKPDGFIRIEEGQEEFEHAFFLEVDRSSEILDTLVGKAACYRDYYRNGGYALRNGAARSDYAEYGFGVLMVFKTAERRNNTAERLLQNNPPLGHQIYLSTFDEATTKPLDAIWIRPIDYLRVTQGTPFDPERRRGLWKYERQSEREKMVEQNVRKRHVLEGEPTEARLP